jgi:cold shock CspA family protein
MLEKGTVKFFNGADNKRFGFIISESGGDDLFFHYNGFRKFEADGREVVFSQTGYNHPAAFPKKDEKVWFVRGKGSKGPIAEPWGYNHDYERVKKEISNCPNYGETFVYVSLCEGNMPEMALEKYGRLTGIADEEEREKYVDMMYERNFNGRYRFTRVIPHPGMEKKLGRAFRQLSYDEGRYGMCHKSIEIVEIPKQYVYTGVLVQEFLQLSRSLTFPETRKLIAMGKPAFVYSDYWHTWSRILGYYWHGEYEQEVAVALTSPHGWDEVKAISIYDGHLSISSKVNEGPFTLLPDTVREDMEEELGADLTKELLTEDYLRLFTVEQIKAATRNHIGGGWLKLEEITGVKPLV